MFDRIDSRVATIAAVGGAALALLGVTGCSFERPPSLTVDQVVGQELNYYNGKVVIFPAHLKFQKHRVVDDYDITTKLVSCGDGCTMPITTVTPSTYHYFDYTVSVSSKRNDATRFLGSLTTGREITSGIYHVEGKIACRPDGTYYLSDGKIVSPVSERNEEAL